MKYLSLVFPRIYLRNLHLLPMIGLFALVGFLSASDANADATMRSALIVGVNEYDPSYVTNNLEGCVNDANDIRNTLMLGDASSRWSSGNLDLVTDGSATKSSVRSKFQTLASTATSGDLVLYFQSSHGGRNSGTSAYICMHDDSYTDTEFGNDLALFNSGVNVIVILDTCHSAGMFKSTDATASSSWNFAENAMASFKTTRTRMLQSRGQSVPRALGSNIAFITACDYDEYSYEIDGHGLFTTNFINGVLYSSSDTNEDSESQFFELTTYSTAMVYADTPSQNVQYYNQTLLEDTIARTNAGGDDPNVLDWWEYYDITTNNATSSSTTASGLIVTATAGGAQIKIAPKRGVSFIEDIPAITVTGNVSTMYVQGNVDGAIAVSGSMKSLTIKNGYAASVAASEIGSVKMDCLVDSSDETSPTYALTSITSGPSTPVSYPNLKVSLVGVGLEELSSFAPNTQISISSKKGNGSAGTIVSYGTLTDGAYSSGDSISVAVKGGHMIGDVYSKGIVKSVTATPTKFKLAGGIETWGGWIGSFDSSSPYQSWICAGGDNWVSANASGSRVPQLIGKVYGASGANVYLVAGYDDEKEPGETPMFLGGIGSVACSPAGVATGGIQGAAYISPNAKTPSIKGDTTALGSKFLIHTN
jgi:hypothetical protein